jgi:hypothetical protein
LDQGGALKDVNMAREDKLRIRAFWNQRPQTLGEFVDMVKPFVARLMELHPIYRRPMMLYRSRGNPDVAELLAEDLSNIEAYLARYGWYPDFGKPTGLSDDGRTMSRGGTTRSSFACNLLPGHDEHSLNRNDYYVKIEGGSPDPVIPGVAWLEFPNQVDPAFETTDFVKQLLLAAVECFDPEIGTIDSKRSAGAVREFFPDIRDTVVPCWLNYFRDAGVRRDLPSWVQCEEFGSHGGVLVSLQPDRPRSIEDPAWIARVRELHAALKPGNWYADA